MEPPKTSAEAAQKALCDRLVEACAETMFNQIGAPVEMIVDRLVTYCVGQMVTVVGKDGAVRILRHVIQQVEDGVFDASERPPVVISLMIRGLPW
ncbi:hypothetical protein NKI48_02625 [Mesorhizobium sp. M0644]|uniref:hypothetical protein n=1 Tax=Mesorhizobium sp. M0644 TaxID=2956979 RepID=UPI00333A924B